MPINIANPFPDKWPSTNFYYQHVQVKVFENNFISLAENAQTVFKKVSGKEGTGTASQDFKDAKQAMLAYVSLAKLMNQLATFHTEMQGKKQLGVQEKNKIEGLLNDCQQLGKEYTSPAEVEKLVTQAVSYTSESLKRKANTLEPGYFDQISKATVNANVNEQTPSIDQQSPTNINNPTETPTLDPNYAPDKKKPAENLQEQPSDSHYAQLKGAPPEVSNQPSNLENNRGIDEEFQAFMPAYNHLTGRLTAFNHQIQNKQTLDRKDQDQVRDILNECIKLEQEYLAENGQNKNYSPDLKKFVSDTISDAIVALKNQVYPLTPSPTLTLARQQFDSSPKVLGKGAFGEVSEYQMTDEALLNQLKALNLCSDTDQSVAIKVFQQNPTATPAKVFKEELELIWEGLRGEALRQGISNSNDNRVNPSTIAILDGQPVIISRLMKNGDVPSYIRNTIELDENQNREALVLPLVKDLILSLNSMHTGPNPMVHRDIAARNLFVDEFGQAFLGDVGLSKEIGHDEQSWTDCKDVGGHFPIKWAPKETIQNSVANRATDCFSASVTILEMLALAAGLDKTVIFDHHKELDKKERIGINNQHIKLLTDPKIGNEGTLNAMKKSLYNALKKNMDEKINDEVAQIRAQYPDLPREQLNKYIHDFKERLPEGQIMNMLYSLDKVISHTPDKTTLKMWEQLEKVDAQIQQRIEGSKEPLTVPAVKVSGSNQQSWKKPFPSTLNENDTAFLNAKTQQSSSANATEPPPRQKMK